MPEYDPAIHGVVTISLREVDFVRYFTDLTSPTHANAYKSAQKAGYSASFSRVITQHISRERMKEVQKIMQDPFHQKLIKRMREAPAEEYVPSKRELKRRQTEQNKRSEVVLRELDELLGARE